MSLHQGLISLLLQITSMFNTSWLKACWLWLLCLLHLQHSLLFEFSATASHSLWKWSYGCVKILMWRGELQNTYIAFEWLASGLIIILSGTFIFLITWNKPSKSMITLKLTNLKTKRVEQTTILLFRLWSVGLWHYAVM